MTNSTQPQVYLLNTPVLTAYGDWRFEGPISVDQARELISAGFVSAVGHPGAAQFLGALLSVDVPVNRISVELQPGDRALVLRLKQRLPEGMLLTHEQMRDFPFELALLRRLTPPNAAKASGSGEAYSPQFDQALRVAAIAHAKKVRKETAIPYLIHPFHVARILERHGASEELVLAGVLHDVLEDAPWEDPDMQQAFRETWTELGDAGAEEHELRAAVEGLLERMFGTAVLELVRGVTERKPDNAGHTRPWRVRKQEQLDHLADATPEKMALKAADLIHNLESTLADLRAGGLAIFGRFNARAEDQLWYSSQIAQIVRRGLGDHNGLAAELRHLFGRYCQEVSAQALVAQQTALYEAAQEAERRAVQAAVITLSKAEVLAKLQSPPPEGRWVIAVDPESQQARILPQQADGFVPDVAGQEHLFPLAMAAEREDGFIEPGDWLVARAPETGTHVGWYRGYLVRWNEYS